MTNKERQARYREKLKSDGMKSLRISISAEAKAAIDAECKRTGETQAQVVERCAAQLGDVNQAMLEIVLKLSRNQFKLRTEDPELYESLTTVSKFFKWIGRSGSPGIFDFKK